MEYVNGMGKQGILTTKTSKELNLMERKEQTAQGANYWNQRRDAQLSREATVGLEGGWDIQWVCFCLQNAKQCMIQPSPFQVPMLGDSPS